MAHYVDTSALVKLVVADHETAALREWFASAERDPVAADLCRTELVRATRRVAPDRILQARAVLDSLILIQVTTATFEHAGRLEPTQLRSLDAIHIAVALQLGDDLEAFVTYDERQAEAARANGINVLGPV